MPPLEAWEKVFLKDAKFMADTHGKAGCVICHGGDSGADDKDVAHGGVVGDPSDVSCSTCHSEIAAHNDMSLHTTLEGFITKLEARGGDMSEGSPLAVAVDNHCQSCHTTCGQCHISRPDEMGGGLVSSHVVRETPSMQYNCVACHGARVGDEYLGSNAGVPGDVHWTKEGMTCTKCHGEELHGDGALAADRYSTATAARCETCHTDVWTDTASNAQHAQHLGDLSCQVCHSVEYKNCYGCHVAIDDEGVPCRTTEPSEMRFEIGLNPVRSSDRPYEYVLLRHVPVCVETWDFNGVCLLPDFGDVSTWKYATPHNIQLHTPQNESCNSCHGNADLFLLEEDVRPSEREANEGVIVDGVPPSR